MFVSDRELIITSLYTVKFVHGLADCIDTQGGPRLAYKAYRTTVVFGGLMKKYVYASLILCLVVGYQNCARNNQFSDMNNSNAMGNTVEATPIEKIDVSQVEIVEIPESSFLESKIQPDIIQSKAASSISTHHLEIDVKTGVINVIEDANGQPISGLQYCLRPEELLNLNSILARSQVCEEKVATSRDQLCIMEYQFPYARLHFVDSQVALGEVFNACQKGFDLCGEQKDQLQAYLGQIQMDLAAKRCEP